MKRKLLSILLIILSISNITFANENIQVNGKSAILLDINSGKVIYSLNEDDRLAPASITKIMTLLLGMDAIKSGKISFNDKVTVSEYASSMGGSQVFLEAGETQIVEDLFKAISIRSANDASVALAEHIAGSEKNFVKLMNEKANSLGMKNTNFTNSSGLPDDGHYLSTRDISIMSMELLKHEEVSKWLTTYMEDMTVGKNKSSIQTMVNTNRLIKEYKGANGIKTGSTNEAGFCISASAKRDDLYLLAIVMGSETSKQRFEDAKQLLDYGFANFKSINLGNKGDIIGNIPVEKSNILDVDIILEKDVYLLISKNEEENINTEILLPEKIDRFLDKGEKVGNMVIYLNGKEVDSVGLLTNDKIEKASLFTITKRFLKSYLNND